jgi:hypothetical protein
MFARQRGGFAFVSVATRIPSLGPHQASRNREPNSDANLNLSHADAQIAPALVSEFSGEVDTLDGSAVLWTEEAFRFEDEEGDENESSSSHTPDVPNPDTDATDATDATDDNNYTDTNSATEAFVAIDGHVWAVTDVLSGDGYIVYLLGHSEERREIDPALLSETHMLKGGGRGGSGGRSSSKSSGSSSSSKGSVGSSSSGSSGSSGSTGGKTVVKGVTSNTGSNSMRPLIIITGNGRSCRSYDNRTCSAADRLSVMWALPVAMLASLVL